MHDKLYRIMVEFPNKHGDYLFEEFSDERQARVLAAKLANNEYISRVSINIFNINFDSCEVIKS